MFWKNRPIDKWSALIAISIGLAAIAFTVRAPALAQEPTPFTANPEVDQIFERWKKTDSPGCALSVKQRGSIVYQRGYGMADLDQNIPIDPKKTVFHAASLAKQFTAMSIMLLVGQGRLSLTDDVHALAPVPSSISCPAVHAATAAPTRSTCPITIGDMLHHVSGLRDQWILVETAGWRLSDDVIRQEDVLNLVGRMKTLNFNPRQEFSYSNTNYTLAGLIVERVSHEPLPDFMRKHVFAPLGMENTTIIKTHGEIVKNRAYGYQTAHPNFEIRMPNYDLVGPTNLLTTVEDLMRWDGNFNSKIVGGDAAVSAMQAPLNSPLGYGLGLSISSENGHQLVEHSGRDAGYRSHLIRFPDQRDRLTVALLCNVALPDGTPTDLLVRKVAAIYLHEPPPQEPQNATERPGDPFTQFHPEDYVGRYYNDEIDTIYEIKQKGSSLEITRPKYDPRELIRQPFREFFKIDNFGTVLKSVILHFIREDSEKPIVGFQMFDNSDRNNPNRDPNRLNNFTFSKRP